MSQATPCKKVINTSIWDLFLARYQIHICVSFFFQARSNTHWFRWLFMTVGQMHINMTWLFFFQDSWSDTHQHEMTFHDSWSYHMHIDLRLIFMTVGQIRDKNECTLLGRWSDTHQNEILFSVAISKGHIYICFNMCHIVQTLDEMSDIHTFTKHACLT